jgi:hypothetical protein
VDAAPHMDKRVDPATRAANSYANSSREPAYGHAAAAANGDPGPITGDGHFRAWFHHDVGATWPHAYVAGASPYPAVHSHPISPASNDRQHLYAPADCYSGS